MREARENKGVSTHSVQSGRKERKERERVRGGKKRGRRKRKELFIFFNDLIAVSQERDTMKERQTKEHCRERGKAGKKRSHDD